MKQKLLRALDELTPLLRASASQADRAARLPREVASALARHELFRLWIPKRAGGLELSLPDALQVYEAAARIEGSVGWAVMIGSGGGLFAAYLREDIAKAIYSPANAVIAGSGAPDGVAERVAGGYRATGRWRYASGADYATTFTANCRIVAGGCPVLAAEGKPLVRALAFDASQVRVTPAWDTSGMRGTGSEDFEVHEVFVPEERSFSVFADPPRETGPLYRLPFGVLTELPVTSVVVGIARHVLESFNTLARRKPAYASGRSMAQDPCVQARFAEGFATWHLVKAGLDSLAARAWQCALEDRPLSAHELAQITAGCALCVARLRTAIAELMALSGMTAIETGEEIARAWRDLQAVAAHGSVSPLRLAGAGAALLGD